MPQILAHVTVGARVALAAHEFFGEEFERDSVLAGIAKGVRPVGVPALVVVGVRGVVWCLFGAVKMDDNKSCLCSRGFLHAQ